MNQDSFLEVRIPLSSLDKKRGLCLPLQLTEDLAYLCGILVGDGSIYLRKEKHDFVIKCVGNPKDEQELYIDVIGPKFNRNFGFTPSFMHHDSRTTFGFALHSKTLFRFLTEIVGLHHGRKNHALQIPPGIRKHPQFMDAFLRGLFDTDGCITFKKRYREIPYYPVISLASQSKKLIREVALELRKRGLQLVEIYDYPVKNPRGIREYTFINRIEMNGKDNLRKWQETIGFESPKHLNKIRKWKEK
ncbi:MAG: LAGLIDADG family homing endonuclease [Nanoarchaeota archaeon]|nr:LAGLIDADG family homing endonuclease [Nanoarchaeota archaeon]